MSSVIEDSILYDEWKQLEKEKADFTKEREELKKEKEEWEALATKLNKVQMGGNRIKLDIGGQSFSTSLTTLTSHKGSFFKAMFSGRWEAKPEDDGCYFIDRDPTVFKHVLNYLRDYLNSRPVTAPSPDTVPTPVKYKFVSGPNYTVSSDGLQITKTSVYEWDATAITNPILSSGIHHFELKIVTAQAGNIMVGVCPTSINQSQECNFKHCGWYFSCHCGTLYSGPPQSAFHKSYYSTSAIGTGREVGVKMDMTNRHISFTVDGVDRGVTDIPVNQSLCFCVLLSYAQNDSVRIVE